MSHNVEKDDAAHVDITSEPTLSGIEFALEGFVDSKGLGYLLDALHNIALAKIEHLESNWQMTDQDADVRYWKYAAAWLQVSTNRIETSRRRTGTYLK
jgi:hypothetical protein